MLGLQYFWYSWVLVGFLCVVRALQLEEVCGGWAFWLVNFCELVHSECLWWVGRWFVAGIYFLGGGMI